MTTAWSRIDVPAACSAPGAAASTTAAVPWMSSLNVQQDPAQVARMRWALAAPKSSPVQHRVRERRRGGGHVRLDQLVIALAADPRVPVAHVQLVIEQALVAGPGVQYCRDDPVRVQPGRGHVQGRLAERDRDPARSQSPIPQDALGIGGHDQVGLSGPSR